MFAQCRRGLLYPPSPSVELVNKNMILGLSEQGDANDHPRCCSDGEDSDKLCARYDGEMCFLVIRRMAPAGFLQMSLAKDGAAAAAQQRWNVCVWLDSVGEAKKLCKSSASFDVME
mmetsp:Transcript_12726/g.23136  ORF Transcript_12726/g.23136 Transcript_12726/m.23136 type:complete len:116 (-) Transcript_12726:190-537(-)